jgi:hypothetical protein
MKNTPIGQGFHNTAVYLCCRLCIAVNAVRQRELSRGISVIAVFGINPIAGKGVVNETQNTSPVFIRVATING